LGGGGGGGGAGSLVVGHPEGYQSRAGGASGGGFRGAAAGFCFAACTPVTSPIGLCLPDDERTRTVRGIFARRAACYGLAMVQRTLMPHSSHRIH